MQLNFSYGCEDASLKDGFIAKWDTKDSLYTISNTLEKQKKSHYTIVVLFFSWSGSNSKFRPPPSPSPSPSSSASRCSWSSTASGRLLNGRWGGLVPGVAA